MGEILAKSPWNSYIILGVLGVILGGKIVK